MPAGINLRSLPHFYVQLGNMDIDFGYWSIMDGPEEPPVEVIGALLFYGKIRVGKAGWIEEWWFYDEDDD
jgi:hypothetical protein